MAKGRKTGGRQKGVPNKVTKDLKDMVLQALDQAGGVTYLQLQAIENPGPFLSLVGKVLPLQVTGKDGAPLGGFVGLQIVAPKEGEKT
jgi:hypothetical protein